MSDAGASTDRPLDGQNVGDAWQDNPALISGLILERFKAFTERQHIRLAPLTLIFGANSAGKSSILQSLLLLKQTRDAGQGMAAASRGPYVDLGEFTDYVSGHEASAQCEISLLLQYPDTAIGEAAWANVLSHIGANNVPFGLGCCIGRAPSRHGRIRSMPAYVGREAAFDVDVTDEQGRATQDPRVHIGRFNPNHPLWPRVFERSPLRTTETLEDLELLGFALTEDRWLRPAVEPGVDIRARADLESLGAPSARSTGAAQDSALAVDAQLFVERRYFARIAMRTLQNQVRLLVREGDATDATSWDAIVTEAAAVLDALETEGATTDERERLLARLRAINESLAPRDSIQARVEDLLEEWDEWMSESPFRFPAEGAHRLIDDAVARLKSYDLEQFLDDIWQTGRHSGGDESLAFSWRADGGIRRWKIGSLPAHPMSLVASLLGRRGVAYSSEDNSGSTVLPHLVQISRDLVAALDGVLERIVYLGPQRTLPNRNELVKGLNDGSPFIPPVGALGESTLAILAGNAAARERVNKWLLGFGIGYEIEVDRVGIQQEPGLDIPAAVVDAFDRSLVRVRDVRPNGVTVELRDVGFGVSQVLPLIVQCNLMNQSILLVEQPELHLHPRLQAHLGSLFVDCVNRGNQIIAETHSEHLIFRVQRLIRDGHLAPNDVSVLYVERGSDGSYCVSLELNEEGEFLHDWPHGFFDEAFNELFGRTELPESEDWA